jgi:hypothetical protein
MDNFIIDNHEIKANYGTTKYCLNFLKNSECKNKDCIFLHKFADKKDIISREKMNSDKDIFPQQRLMAIELSKILTNEKYKELYKFKDIKTVFPNGFSVYTKQLVVRYIKEKHSGISLNLKYYESIIEIKNKAIESNKNAISENNKENISKNVETKKEKNDIEIYGKTIFAKYINIKDSLSSLFKSAPKSRFSFVRPDYENKEIKQIIPSQINDFLTQQFIFRLKIKFECISLDVRLLLINDLLINFVPLFLFFHVYSIFFLIKNLKFYQIYESIINFWFF